MFDHSPYGKKAGERLLTCVQGNHVLEYALEFRTIAAKSSWNDTVLKVACCRGLHAKVLSEIAYIDEQLMLNSLIDLTIRLDHLLLQHPPSFQRATTSFLMGRPRSWGEPRIKPEVYLDTDPMIVL